MRTVEKIAITLPRSLLEAVEERRRSTGESRSEFIRRAVETSFRVEREQEEARRYAEAYLRAPERASEVEAVHALGVAALAEEPWE